MARSRTRKDLSLKFVWTIILVWFALLAFQDNSFGQLGLGVLLLVGGIWGLARGKETWASYVKDYKKLPAARRNQWNQPRLRYYYFNMVVLMPLAIVLGLSLILLAYLIGV